MKITFNKPANKLVAGIATTLAAVFAIGSVAQADECNRIENYARKIQRKTQLLVKETIRYRHTAQYPALVQETSALCAAANHILDIVHFENNLCHLQADLATMDRCLHRLEDLFEATDCAANRGQGHVYGPTGHVKRLLRSIDRSIRKMQRDVQRIAERTERHRPVYVPPVQTNPNHFYSGLRPADPGFRYGGHPNNLRFSTSGINSGIYFRF